MTVCLNINPDVGQIVPISRAFSWDRAKPKALTRYEFKTSPIGYRRAADKTVIGIVYPALHFDPHTPYRSG
jgi:hypothetical protein